MTTTRLLAALLACTAAPAAWAQDAPFCGGISLVGTWAGGTPEASDALGPEAFFDLRGAVPIAGHLVTLFEASQPGAVRIDVAALPSGDPYVALYDESGGEVAADDDGGGGYAASLTADLQPGRYCLATRSYESGVTDVSVQIGRPELFPEPAPGADGGDGGGFDGGGGGGEAAFGPGCGEPGVAVLADGALDPAALAAGPSVVGTAGGMPAVEFTLTEATALSVTAYSDTGDPIISLLDPDGGLIDENDDFDGLNSRIDVTYDLSPGTYCVELEDLNGDDHAITVALEAFDPVADRARRLGLMEFSPAGQDEVEIVELGTIAAELTHDVQASDVAQWLAFDLPEPGVLIVEAVSAERDPEVKLFDRLGRELAYNDDAPGGGLDSLLTQRVGAGRHVLGVRILDAGAQGNVRVLLERYVRAR